jgi:hypothetical protein
LRNLFVRRYGNWLELGGVAGTVGASFGAQPHAGYLVGAKLAVGLADLIQSFEPVSCKTDGGAVNRHDARLFEHGQRTVASLGGVLAAREIPRPPLMENIGHLLQGGRAARSVERIEDSAAHLAEALYRGTGLRERSLQVTFAGLPDGLLGRLPLWRGPPQTRGAQV